MKRRYTLAALVASVAFAPGCGIEQYNDRPLPARRMIYVAARENNLMPVVPVPEATIKNPYADSAEAIEQGRRLFIWYNCYGCHGGYGGGGIGPAFIDSVWIFGREPDNIFATIAKGRPTGMPVWGVRIPEDRIWQLVAYVRSLSPYETAQPVLVSAPASPAAVPPGAAPPAE